MSRRPRSRRLPETIGHLAPKTVAVLLDGWGAKPPVASAYGFSGAFLELFEANDAGIIRLWTRHREALLMQAEEWRWTPQYDGVFFGEWVTTGGERNGR